MSSTHSSQKSGTEASDSAATSLASEDQSSTPARGTKRKASAGPAAKKTSKTASQDTEATPQGVGTTKAGKKKKGETPKEIRARLSVRAEYIPDPDPHIEKGNVALRAQLAEFPAPVGRHHLDGLALHVQRYFNHIAKLGRRLFVCPTGYWGRDVPCYVYTNYDVAIYVMHEPYTNTGPFIAAFFYGENDIGWRTSALGPITPGTTCETHLQMVQLFYLRSPNTTRQLSPTLYPGIVGMIPSSNVVQKRAGVTDLRWAARHPAAAKVACSLGWASPQYGFARLVRMLEKMILDHAPDRSRYAFGMESLQLWRATGKAARERAAEHQAAYTKNASRIAELRTPHVPRSQVAQPFRELHMLGVCALDGSTSGGEFIHILPISDKKLPEWATPSATNPRCWSKNECRSASTCRTLNQQIRRAFGGERHPYDIRTIWQINSGGVSQVGVPPLTRRVTKTILQPVFYMGHIFWFVFSNYGQVLPCTHITSYTYHQDLVFTYGALQVLLLAVKEMYPFRVGTTDIWEYLHPGQHAYVLLNEKEKASQGSGYKPCHSDFCAPLRAALVCLPFGTPVMTERSFASSIAVSISLGMYYPQCEPESWVVELAFSSNGLEDLAHSEASLAELGFGAPYAYSRLLYIRASQRRGEQPEPRYTESRVVTRLGTEALPYSFAPLDGPNAAGSSGADSTADDSSSDDESIILQGPNLVDPSDDEQPDVVEVEVPASPGAAAVSPARAAEAVISQRNASPVDPTSTVSHGGACPPRAATPPVVEMVPSASVPPSSTPSPKRVLPSRASKSPIKKTVTVPSVSPKAAKENRPSAVGSHLPSPSPASRPDAMDSWTQIAHRVGVVLPSSSSSSPSKVTDSRPATSRVASPVVSQVVEGPRGAGSPRIVSAAQSSSVVSDASTSPGGIGGPRQHSPASTRSRLSDITLNDVTMPRWLAGENLRSYPGAAHYPDAAVMEEYDETSPIKIDNWPCIRFTHGVPIFFNRDRLKHDHRLQVTSWLAVWLEFHTERYRSLGACNPRYAEITGVSHKIVVIGKSSNTRRPMYPKITRALLERADVFLASTVDGGFAIILPKHRVIYACNGSRQMVPQAFNKERSRDYMAPGLNWYHGLPGTLYGKQQFCRALSREYANTEIRRDLFDQFMDESLASEEQDPRTQLGSYQIQHLCMWLTMSDWRLALLYSMYCACEAVCWSSRMPSQLCRFPRILPSYSEGFELMRGAIGLNYHHSMYRTHADSTGTSSCSCMPVVPSDTIMNRGSLATPCWCGKAIDEETNIYSHVFRGDCDRLSDAHRS